MRSEGWPEHGREDEALRKVIADWHCLTPEVRAAIIDLSRGVRPNASVAQTLDADPLPSAHAATTATQF